VLEALNVACAVGPVMVVAWVMLRLVLQGSSQVMLCMECEQCVRGCMLEKRSEPVGPREIMSAAKTGDMHAVLALGVLNCNSCKACQRLCPRGLAPYQELERWRPPRVSQASGLAKINDDPVSTLRSASQ
jgi:heterodisulfide reductase subunit C